MYLVLLEAWPFRPVAVCLNINSDLWCDECNLAKDHRPSTVTYSLHRGRIFDLVFTIYIMETCISEEVPVQRAKTALCNPEEALPVASQYLPLCVGAYAQ